MPRTLHPKSRINAQKLQGHPIEMFNKSGYNLATFLRQADVAQLVEQLICNQSVTGSIPVVGSRF